MEEQINLGNSLTREELLKVHRQRKLNTITNIILIVIILIVGWYAYSNIELFKLLGQDPCKICSDKTGAVCIVQKFFNP